MITGFIQNLDIFGQGIHLTINKKEKSQTILGGILTIILVGLLFSMFYVTAQDVFYVQNPSVAVEDRILERFPNLTLDKDNFPFGVALTANDNSNIYRPEYFRYEVVHSFGETTSDLQQVTYDLINCTEDNFPKINRKQLRDMGMFTNFCVKDQNFTVGGSWGEDYISYISLRLGLCRNSTYDDKCAPCEEIEQFLGHATLYWNIYFMNSAMNSQSLSDPITYYLVNLYKSVEFDKYKYVDMTLKNISMQSDEGFILKSVNNNSSYSLHDSRFDVSDTSRERILVEFDITASNSFQITHRTYTKIQSVLAGIGGMANILRITFVLICYTFSIIKRNEIILNQIFDYDLVENNLKVEKKLFHSNIKKSVRLFNTTLATTKRMENNFLRPTKIIGVPKANSSNANNKTKKSININLNIDRAVDNVFVNDNLRNFRTQKSEEIKSPRARLISANDSVGVELKDVSLEEDIEAKEIIDALERRSTRFRLKFSFWEILQWYILRCCASKQLRAKKRLYNKTFHTVNEFIDITFIIQKLEEFEKLKFILLSEQQLAMFNFISKDFCSLRTDDKEDNQIHKLKQFSSNKENLAKFLVSFKPTFDKATSNVKDKKLFELLNEDIKLSFQHTHINKK